MSTTTERTYWKLGDGDPYNGGRFGYDERVLVGDDDPVVLSTSSCRPANAVTITGAEHDQLVAAFRATWEQRAAGGAAFVADVVADARALRASAAAKLAAGAALTADEAAAVTST